jgi:RNase P/RNase MRP subunit POP5
MIGEMRQHCKHLFDTDCKALGIYLTRFNGEQGIVKCNHVEKGRTIELLTSLNKIAYHKVEIETVGTSGTIKSLVKKHMNNSL